MSPVLLFFVTTSPCREWVICAPATFLGCGSRFYCAPSDPVGRDQLPSPQWPETGSLVPPNTMGWIRVCLGGGPCPRTIYSHLAPPQCKKTFWRPGLRPDPAGGAYSAPRYPIADGEGTSCPSPSHKNPTPAIGPLGLLLGPSGLRLATTIRGLAPPNITG